MGMNVKQFLGYAEVCLTELSRVSFQILQPHELFPKLDVPECLWLTVFLFLLPFHTMLTEGRQTSHSSPLPMMPGFEVLQAPNSGDL